MKSILMHPVGEILAEREDVAAQNLANLWVFLGLGVGIYILCILIAVLIYMAVDHDGIIFIMLVIGFPIAFLVAEPLSSHWVPNNTQYEEQLEAAVIENIEENLNVENVEITSHKNKTNHDETYSAELIGLANGEYVNFTARYNDDHGLMIPVAEDNANLSARAGSDLETLLNDSESAS